MDLNMYDGQSESEDFQATQIMEDLLAPASSPLKAGEHRNPLLKNLFAESNEMSTESQLSSRASNSVPQYHFHGLASTQTQTQSQQYVEEDVDVIMEEGSQKENIAAAKSGKEAYRTLPSPLSRSPSPRPSPTKAVHPKAAPGTTSNISINTTVTKKTTNVTFESPRQHRRVSVSPSKPVTRQSPHKPGPSSSRYKPVPRPSSRASSVDSFAHDPELDNPQKRLIANTHQFNIPISELDKDSPSFDLSDVSGGIMRFRSAGDQSTKPIILAPNSSGELSTSHSSSLDELRRLSSQDYQETQLVDPDATQPFDASGSGYGTSPSPSQIIRNLRGETVDIPVVPLENTQPSTQLEEESEALQNQSHRRAFDSILSAVPTTAQTSSSRSVARPSLFNMIAPEKQARYQKFIDAKRQNTVQQQGTSSTGPETQPSLLEVPPPRRGFPIRRAPPRQPSPIADVLENMEVVPDSEPMAAPELSTSKVQSVAGPSRPSSALTTVPANKTPVKAAAATKSAAKPLPVLHENAEQDDESEEESAPLAEVVVKRPRGRPPNSSKAKGKAKAAEPDPPAPVPTAAKGKAPAKTFQRNHTTRTYANRSWETGYIPSSVPDQDSRGIVNLPKMIPPPPATKKSQKVTRSTSNVPKSKGKKVKAEKQREKETEESEEEYDEPEEDEGGTGRAGKRKRGQAAATKVTPANKRTKRVVVEDTTDSGTRVLALWPSDGHWYPGRVYSMEKDRYIVHFDDKTKASLVISDMRRGDIRPGDDVLFGSLTRPARVESVNGDKLKVSFDGQIYSKIFGEIRIPNMAVRYAWDDRKLVRKDIVTSMPTENEPDSPSPSVSSLKGITTPKGKGVMATTYFVITCGTKEDRGASREAIKEQVKKSGGHEIVRFPEGIIDMKGVYSSDRHRWTLTKSAAVWIGNSTISRVFLVADEACQTVKYLMALALGIPCVSTTWLVDSKDGQEKEWSAYLLANGFSPIIGTRLSQQVDLDWGTNIYNLHCIMDNMVPCKLFKGMSMLFLLSNASCQQKNRRRPPGIPVDDETNKSKLFAGQILLAMGAETVETVSDSRYASRNLQNYDYIVLHDSCSYQLEYDNLPVVEWAWVKDCLIACRILPIPVRESQESQEV